MDIMDDVMHVLSGDEEVPDFLNRKLNPQTRATLEERQAFSPPQQQVEPLRLNGTDEEALREIEEEQRSTRKAKADARISKMLAKRYAKSQTKGIPDDFLSWDAKTSKFYDVRVRAARKHAAARAEAGLPVQTEAEARASVVRCLGLKSWEKK